MKKPALVLSVLLLCSSIVPLTYGGGPIEYEPAGSAARPGQQPSYRPFIAVATTTGDTTQTASADGLITAPKPTALIGAMPLEMTLLESRLQEKQSRVIMGITFHTGLLNNQPVVLVASGVGKVNAAMVATLMIEQFQPQAVIFTGIAGGVAPELRPGDLIIGSKTIHHDYGSALTGGFQIDSTRNPHTTIRNPLTFPAPEWLLNLATEAAQGVRFESIIDRPPTVRRGIIATGDLFVASPDKCAEIRRSTGADAVEMEGAAVAQICWQQQTPCLVIRAMSDNADARATFDAKVFRNVAADNSARLVMAIMERLGAGHSTDSPPLP